MAGPAHMHVVIEGTLGSTEVFNFGFDVLGAAGNQATLQSVCDDTAAVLTTSGANQTAFKQLLTSTSAYTKVKAYSYAASATAASLQAEKVINVAGAGSGINPFQTCLVASLITATPGRRTRGRMYLPAVGLDVSTQGLGATPTPASVATACAALINAARSASSAVVISRVGNSAAAIVSVRVDNKPDTQRRRANKLLATVSGSANL